MTPDEQIYLQKFENSELEAKDFDHRGHLYMAWLHLKYLPLEAANQKICNGIQALANKLGVPQKYNRTLSEALVRLMSQRLNEASRADFDTFMKDNLDLVEDCLGVLHQYYSPDRLISPKAKSNWVEPDLCSIA